MGSLESDCPVSDIVSDVGECQAAAAELGIDYAAAFGHFRRPAGCYYWNNTLDKKVYFNDIIDPAVTTPDPVTGGVCKKSRSYNIQCKVYQYMRWLFKGAFVAIILMYVISLLIAGLSNTTPVTPTTGNFLEFENKQELRLKDITLDVMPF